MKTKEELEEAMKYTITMHKEIIFGSDTLSCMACLVNFQSSRLLIKNIWSKANRKYNEETRMGGTSKKYCDGWCHDDWWEDRWGEVDSWRSILKLNPEVDSTYWNDQF